MIRSAAVLTVKDAGSMSTRGKKQIAVWLRKQADALLKDGHLYGKTVRIRYLFNTKKGK